MDSEGPAANKQSNIGSQETIVKAAQRKRLFSVVAAAGLAALVIGFVSLFNTINSAFSRPLPITEVSSSDVNDELKNRDTDSDGINDYDEIFSRHTSIFVKDSDSDGVNDGDEVAKGSDPNCPEGKSCGLTDDQTTGLNQDAVTLRETLKKSGAPAYVIDQTDDATLISQYQQLIGGNQNDGVSQAGLKSLSATQIRSLLISNGVAEADLSSVDDTTLLQLYQEVLTNPDSSSS